MKSFLWGKHFWKNKMEPGKAPKTSDKWLDSPFNLSGLREKFGISSGVIWGIVLSTQ